MVLSKKRARHVIEEIIALFPDAKPSLDFRNHFELLVAVMLSAQTTDAAVNKATPNLFLAYPTPEAMAAASEADIAKHISRLGLYRNKAKFLKKCAQQLLDDFNGQVPQTREELETLAGVGRKTANVVKISMTALPRVLTSSVSRSIVARMRGSSPKSARISASVS